MRFAVPLLAFCAGLAACGSGPGDSGATRRAVRAADSVATVADSLASTADSVTSAAADSLIAGTPVGGLADWVADVRQGLSGLATEAVANVSAAQQKALNLYLSRQEYIEMYYGAAGRLSHGGTLGEAVSAAEQQYHRLLQLLGGEGAVTRAQVQAALDTLSVRYRDVLSEAQ
ncbi:MAG TPA: hypothetical protein VJ957_09850, partial [Longimicrobiales bacterium]|nr:hypothetical protein [Longimicrobiales bacterium]